MTSSPEGPGRVASAMDVATAVFAALGLILVCTGPYRDVFDIGGGGVISIGWMHAAFAAAAIAAVRHAALPRPTLLASVRQWRGDLQRRPAFADALLAFWLTRPTVRIRWPAGDGHDWRCACSEGCAAGRPGAAAGAAGAVGRAVVRRAGRARVRMAAQLRSAAEPRLLSCLSAADPKPRGGDRRVSGGRAAGASDRAPDVVRAVDFARRFLLGGLVLRAARSRNDGRVARARRAAVAVGVSVRACSSAPPTPSRCSCSPRSAAWFHFRRGEHLAAGGWGLLAGLTRPNGCFLSIPLGLLALGMRDAPGNGTIEGGPVAPAYRWRRCRASACCIFTGVLYQMTGIWFAWSKTHAAWGRVVGGETPLAGLDRSRFRWPARFRL